MLCSARHRRADPGVIETHRREWPGLRVLAGVYALAFGGTLTTVIAATGFADFGLSVAMAAVMAGALVVFVYVSQWVAGRRRSSRR